MGSIQRKIKRKQQREEAKTKGEIKKELKPIVDAKLQVLKDEAFTRGYNQGTEDAIIAILMALRDSEGFGQKRILRVLNKSMGILDAVHDGYLNKLDMKETLVEEVGIKL